MEQVTRISVSPWFANEDIPAFQPEGTKIEQRGYSQLEVVYLERGEMAKALNLGSKEFGGEWILDGLEENSNFVLWAGPNSEAEIIPAKEVECEGKTFTVWPLDGGWVVKK